MEHSAKSVLEPAVGQLKGLQMLAASGLKLEVDSIRRCECRNMPQLTLEEFDCVQAELRKGRAAHKRFGRHLIIFHIAATVSVHSCNWFV